MDQRVLEAQQWVNAAYTGVPGYERCEENGRTGWATMFSLTRGLQHELGITELSDTFGPTTMGLIAAQGPIGQGYSRNANIVRIIQHGLFCKGYDAGETQTGRFHSGTAGAVSGLKTDIGLFGSDGTVDPKIFKAILNMDAYVMLSGGRPRVQTIQRWLNGKYLNRSTFFVIPCDGIYSRDVQQALMKAIQYEVGIPDDNATGNFGPGTQAGLARNPVGPGSSQSWVELFSSACAFNSPIRRPDGGATEAGFQYRWDDDLASWVRMFQRFSLLEESGVGDYRTWAQLLVSMGDPDRPVSACDTSRHILGGRGARLFNAGYRVVGRYLDESPDESLDKELQPGELAAIFAAGLRVFPISQYYGRGLEDFSWSKGYDHALLAHGRAVGYGFNAGTVIYFAVDYDATSEEITSNIVPYFNGVAAGLRSRGGRYVQGVYGSRNVCSRVSSESYARHSFVSGMSYGFSGNLGFPMPDNWAFTQIKEFFFEPSSSDSFPLDNNVWRGTDPGCGPENVNGRDATLDEFLAFTRTLYSLAVSYGGDPTDRVLEYLRYPKYDGVRTGWTLLIGSVDEAWVRYVNERVANPVRSFLDPATRLSVNLDHLAATAHAVYRKGTGPGTASTRGDFGGWAGDLCTLYGEWRYAESSYASGYLFVEARFAKLNVESTFALTDYIQDCDGQLIGTAARAGGRIDDVIAAYMTGTGPATRFRQFYLTRHGGSAQNVFTTAKNMLNGLHGDVELYGLQSAAILLSGGVVTLPTDMPDYKLDPFVQGYADAVERLSRG
ncbi:glycoside hydrolase domain-containing protein [Umezawaea tangerina]|uniref:Peptidoglycan hydrolase-like protein with peptidoglycan-binding domain n=1 Tax=Umezawaea tangerina TaxID=84725 RepID=A0A2T0T6U8_9PSEU|nr:glycoside hydrolase domain-containing protein [Umezawaea tangerina]PRY41406.1 peptidoglycan hydrolase-like protein with peptidoglycan-binding domain [Umezawaea tangerina]